MPFALLIVGIVLVVAAVRDKADVLFTLVKDDFISQPGKPSFMYWLAAILIIGAIGYIKPLQGLSRIFLALLVVVLVLAHGGLFDQFNRQLFSSAPASPGVGGAGSIQSGNQ